MNERKKEEKESKKKSEKCLKPLLLYYLGEKQASLFLSPAEGSSYHAGNATRVGLHPKSLSSLTPC